MNRLCQSSYGNLEGVINYAGHDGNPERQLVHFCRERLTGKWHIIDVVSTKPWSGGSMIQNCTKRRPDQAHGDFEVLVLKSDGVMKHYTRDNTIPVDSGVHAWKDSATVNEKQHPQYSKIVACGAAPLYQSTIPVGNSSEGCTLETALLTENGDERADRITNVGATAPAWLYQDSKDDLKALIPLADGIAEFSFMCGVWNWCGHIPNADGPACTYIPNPAVPSEVCIVARHNDELYFETKDKKGEWPDLRTCCQKSSPLRKLSLSPCHRERQGIPIAIVSRSLDALSHSPNAEAIVFHPCGSGWHDSWMVLHWTYLTTTKEWILSGVVLSEVVGMPM
ncbi:hypothetical protein F4677DRAFT_450002 [Hypoxylon crocopeplum]|nr:hypothetical protein F4677DRAFT_450002 [Hypoxylon crocopeplum]